MPTPPDYVLLDDVTRAAFDAGPSEVGPGTDWCIRYALADYYRMVQRYFRELRITGAWTGPCAVDYTLHYEGATDHEIASAGVGSGEVLDISFPGRVLMVIDGPRTTTGGFSECPFADGIGDPREDAGITLTGTGGITLTFSLFAPKCEQHDWSTATEVWVKFALSVTTSSGLQYLCDPSGVTGFQSGPATGHNFLGIDVTGGSVFPGATSSIPLGDGTTSAFFADPGTTDKLTINDLQTNNF